jgi:hypothetical protein
MNFLRDLFGIQYVKVNGEDVPASKTVSFEGAVSGDFDPETQEIIVTVGPLPEADRPTVSGATTQQQLDSVIAALVTLGLIIDDR